MSIIKIDVKTNITLELTLEEAGALDAIAGYGHKAFLEVFKDKMGKHYIEKNGYDKHVESLFNKARTLDSLIKKVNEGLRNIPRTIKI